MEYSDFIVAIKEIIDDEVPLGVTVETTEVLKNNGYLRKGFIFKEEGVNVFPTVYLEDYYEKYLKGVGLDEISVNVLDCFYRSRMTENFDIEFFTDFEKVRDKLFCKLINARNNEDMLKEVPYEMFLDLAIVVYYRFYENTFGMTSVLIRNEHLKDWGIDSARLLEIAKRNTEENMVFEISDIYDLLRGSVADIDMGDAFESVRKLPMYVITNAEKVHGAVFMIYEDKVKKLAEQLGDDIYILPSSIHDLIAVPVQYDSDVSKLNEMIEQVNETEVAKEDILGNHAYIYRQRTGFCI